MNEEIWFCQHLAGQFHGVSTLLGDHLSENEELLPHVFFGDLTRHILTDSKDKIALVQCLEDAMSSGVTSVKDLIAVSFVENIETQEELANILNGVNGSKIREEWNRQHISS
jgi:hypothetical protein